MKTKSKRTKRVCACKTYEQTCKLCWRKSKRFRHVIDFASWNDGVARGLEMAADFVEMFDDYVNHAYKLSDCIRFKFNMLPKGKVRKNKRKHVIVGIWNK